ncbi:MAG TPA: hypothetical protein DCE42_05705 [Myxococcales bacterium]|nr:hypothetical protein [Deltaproteobacteria bacterium]MBU49102.1 hypothetical protein [Deltaproteobacteria bacterium]HAA54228.1 hypothetical protein [Myxococcales bacterium]
MEEKSEGYEQVNATDLSVRWWYVLWMVCSRFCVVIGGGVALYGLYTLYEASKQTGYGTLGGMEGAVMLLLGAVFTLFALPFEWFRTRRFESREEVSL